MPKVQAYPPYIPPTKVVQFGAGPYTQTYVPGARAAKDCKKLNLIEFNWIFRILPERLPTYTHMEQSWVWVD